MDVIDNIARIRKERGYTQPQLSKLIGMSASVISNYENRISKPSIEVINKIAEALEVDTAELWADNKNHVKEPVESYGNVTRKTTRSIRQNMIVVPVKAFAGFSLGYADKTFLDTLERRAYPEIHGECYAFEVEGFSMYRTKVIDGELFETGYKPGSFVYTTIVENFNYLNKGKNYVFQTIDGIIMKRFLKIEDNKCYIESINSEYNPVKPIPLKSIKVVYLIERSDNKEN